MAEAPLTEQVHHYLERVVGVGDVAVDATAGNGHDTLLLARLVGETGHLFAFDIQPQAIEATRRLLAVHGLAGRVELVCDSHATMAVRLEGRRGSVSAVLFNLGYLPGGDKRRTTKIDSTLAALDQAAALLADGGVISVLAYTGHAGGREECEAVRQWAQSMAGNGFELQTAVPAGRRNPPEWMLLRRIGETARRSVN